MVRLRWLLASTAVSTLWLIRCNVICEMSGVERLDVLGGGALAGGTEVAGALDSLPSEGRRPIRRGWSPPPSPATEQHRHGGGRQHGRLLNSSWTVVFPSEPAHIHPRSLHPWGKARWPGR